MQSVCHFDRSGEWSKQSERHGRFSREVAARKSGDERVQISNYFRQIRPHRKPFTMCQSTASLLLWSPLSHRQGLTSTLGVGCSAFGVFFFRERLSASPQGED